MNQNVCDKFRNDSVPIQLLFPGRTGNHTFKAVPGNRRVCIFPGN